MLHRIREVTWNYRNIYGVCDRGIVFQNANPLRNDKNIISSISVTNFVFDDYLGKSNYRAIPKVKT